MTTTIAWEKRALTDRENIFIYMNKAAGAMVAIAVDDRFVGMIEILKDNPLAGVKAGRKENSESL